MRTNIDIDDVLINLAMRASGAKTKREAVTMGLEELIRRQRQLKVLESFGKLRWEGDLEELRTSQHLSDDGFHKG